ncbi:hypothetical protein RHMOL_Rhmol01G0245800 [Rhododendron molle]|uniref:Uncharacterized protein n=1 Tax=Rhododendron molle TaxID=49168 RepID=A0ACC0Q5K4_RHOML|nr:hypothetical protein RHMOL_Rhmol01G0245800 [Rhododendron molle]
MKPDPRRERAGERGGDSPPPPHQHSPPHQRPPPSTSGDLSPPHRRVHVRRPAASATSHDAATEVSLSRSLSLSRVGVLQIHEMWLLLGNGSYELHLLILFPAFSAGLGVLNMAVQAVKRMAGADANPQFFLLDKDGPPWQADLTGLKRVGEDSLAMEVLKHSQKNNFDRLPDDMN